MKPSRPREGATVDLLDVLLRDGVVLSADVVVTVADVPLVGIQLRAAIAGMATMTDHGMLEDVDRRRRGADGYGPDGVEERAGVEDVAAGTRQQDGSPKNDEFRQHDGSRRHD